MPSGPLPQPNKRRRNAPTIPTTVLPAGGRDEAPPRCPLELGKAGRRWWLWAWKQPQAAAWSTGDVQAVARRARLEDERSLINLSADDLMIPIDPAERQEWLRSIEAQIKVLKRLAAGVLSVEREMTQLDDRLGLNPKARQALRWEIKDDAETSTAKLVSVPNDRWKNAASG